MFTSGISFTISVLLSDNAWAHPFASVTKVNVYVVEFAGETWYGWPPMSPAASIFSVFDKDTSSKLRLNGAVPASTGNES